MSTYDMIREITQAYTKLSDEGFIGHNMPLMAIVSGSTSRVFGDIMPNCGPLLFINQSRQRYPVSGTINFTYLTAVESGYVTETLNGVEYQRMYYTGATSTYSGTIYIASGQREYSQQLYNDHYVRKIESITCDDPTQEIKVYCLADNGARLLYGINNELIRGLIDITERGVFIAPPICKLCGGTGVYEGETCIDCNGYKYVGRNAEKWLLSERAADVGIIKQTESEESMQYRAWAKKWHLIPTSSEIIRYFSHFLRLSEEYITIEEYNEKECYFVIRFPLSFVGDLGVGDILSISGTTIQSLLDDIEPAGVNGVAEGFYLFSDESATWDYCHDFSEKPHTSFVQPEFGFIFPFDQCGWNMASFGNDFGSASFYNLTGYYGVMTGEIDTGTGFYEFLTEDDVIEVYTHDKPFVQVSGVYY